MNDLHNKIEVAKNLLLKENEINNKTHTPTSLEGNSNLSIVGLIGLTKDNLIKLNNYHIQQGYINEYEKKGRELEAKIEKIRVASSVAVAGYFNTESTHNPFVDKYCGLGKGYYEKLTDKPQIELDVLSFQALARQDVAQKFLSFDIRFSPEKIRKFLDDKIDKFIKDELELSKDKTDRLLGYQKQKEHFAIAIAKEISKGYSPNNLKIDYTQIWSKDIILRTSFLETALGMEREGLIEIKDIIYPKNPYQTIIMTSDSFWRYPTIIQLKTLPDFNKYYDLIYKKYNATQTNQVVKESLEKTISENTKIAPVFEITIRDREIRVNNWLISKPHAVGSNFEFFEYVRSNPANTLIERGKMPKWGDEVGYASVKEKIKNKSFIKILNELGFKGEILKAFFYKRSRDSLTYRGDEITKEDLEKAGIKTSLFLKELELAHTKNSPE